MFTRYLIRYFRVFIVTIGFLSGMMALSQEKEVALQNANEKFNQKKYVEAETDYRILSSKYPNDARIRYNLGNAIYKQNLPQEAKSSYSKAIYNTKDKFLKSDAFNGLGNIAMKEKDYSNAVENYKNALRNNPSDEQTRYNLALAKKMLKEHPPKKDGEKDKKKKDDKSKKKDERDKKKNENDKNKDERDKKKDDNGQPKPQPNAISKQRLENLLNAVNHEEKKVQDKMKGKKVKGNPVDNEKDW